jgi:hypothetical protein
MGQYYIFLCCDSKTFYNIIHVLVNLRKFNRASLRAVNAAAPDVEMKLFPQGDPPLHTGRPVCAEALPRNHRCGAVFNDKNRPFPPGA